MRGRAIPYAQRAGGFRIDMPFENVHGNGGLLTTVGDPLKCNEHFVAPRIDEYAFGGYTLRVIRDAQGQPNELSRRGSRVFDLRFKRVN